MPPNEPDAAASNDRIARFRRDLAIIDDLSPGLLGHKGAVAVSGGPDSMALMWLMRTVHGQNFRVVSVDHALRPGSAEEVARVAKEARAMGLPHSILTLEWPQGGPTANIQSDARIARYAALEEWAEKHALAWIMTAHHADDQAETMVMRLVRGSGLAGLAGIRRMRRSGPVMLVRPLLDWRKQELQDICHLAGLPVSDDPTNRDPRHDRSRIRAMLSQPGMPDAPGLAATAIRLGDAEAALEWTTQEVVRTRCRWENGECRFDQEGLPDELVRRTLAAVVATMGDEARGQAVHRAMLAVRRGETVMLGQAQIRPGALWTIRKIAAKTSTIAD